MIKIRFRSADVMAMKALDEQKARQYLLDLQRDAPLVFPWGDALEVVRSIQAGRYVTVGNGAMDVNLKMVSEYQDWIKKQLDEEKRIRDDRAAQEMETNERR